MSTIKNSSVLKLKGLVRRYLPGVMPLALRFSSRFLTMKEERAYFLKGERASTASKPSLILLSQPRAGTQVCEHVFAKLYHLTGGLSINVGKFFFHYNASAGGKVSSVEWVRENTEEEGYFFGHLGPFATLEGLPDANYILMTRDPRDVLVSHYFSVKEAHVINSKKMKEKVEKVQNMSLSDYCHYEPILQDLERYLEQAEMVRKSNLSHLYLRYEDMMYAPEESLKKVAQLIGVKDADVITIAKENFQIVEESEDLLSHRRSGKWGQFLEKLTVEDQEFLWERFGDKISTLGYQKESLSDII